MEEKIKQSTKKRGEGVGGGRRRRLLIVTIVIVIVIASSLVIWTIEAPETLDPLPSGQLASSLISYSKTIKDYNFTDSSGTYEFRFGIDYQPVVNEGAAAEVIVYAALLSESIHSGFSKGVALSVQSASLALDGKVDTGVKFVTRRQGLIDSFLFQYLNTTLSIGMHNMTARLLVSTVDVDYIGYFEGNLYVVVLNGSFNVTTSS